MTGRKLRQAIRRYLFSAKDHKFHFIHIPKNGGQSLRHALALHRDISLSNPFHYRYRDVAGSLSPSLKFFCVVRNPWSRTASRYLFARQTATNWPESDPRKQYITKASFADFVRDQKILSIPEHPGQPWMGPLSSWFNQLDWIEDESGRVACDCLRLERVEEDISAYLGRRISVPRRNVTNERMDYRRMYDDHLAEVIARTFARDIEFFGFSFGTGATRNVFALARKLS